MNFVSHNLSPNINPPLRGKAVAERLGHMRPDARAVLALTFTNGTAIGCLTRKQAARLTGVSPYNIALAAIATPDEREGLMRGRLKLRHVRAAHAKSRKPSDSEIVDFIARADPNRVLSILDKLTAPVSTAAE
jgi:hypothetical protein